MALGSRLNRGNVGYGDQGVYSPQHLYEEARNRCWEYSREVINILRRCLNSTLFKFDASLIRDKVIEVALFLAGEAGWNEDQVETPGERHCIKVSNRTGRALECTQHDDNYG